MESEEQLYSNYSKTERSSEFAYSARPYMQRTGYDKPSEYRALAINLVRKNDVFNCLPTDMHSSVKSLCYVSGIESKI